MEKSESEQCATELGFGHLGLSDVARIGSRLIFVSRMPVTVEEQGNVFVVKLGEDENKFNPTLVAGLNRALDVAEKSEGGKGLVITAVGKFFSFGLDLTWLGSTRTLPFFAFTIPTSCFP